MKKWMALWLAVLLLAAPAAFAESEQLVTVDELLSFCDTLLERALSQRPLIVERTEDGLWRHTFAGFALVSQDMELNASSRVTAAEVTGADALPEGMRGLNIGSPLSAVLGAFPLDNPGLNGTREEAVLYIRGLLPAAVCAGWVLRSGADVALCEHDIYTVDGETAEKCCVVCTFEDGHVTGIAVSLAVQMLSLEEAQEEINLLSEKQEAGDYSADDVRADAVFSREDLTFCGVDFLSATPETAVRALGTPFSDTTGSSGIGFLRVMQWEGLEMVFSYTEAGALPRLEIAELFGEGLQGPRGICVDESLAAVMGRFTAAARQDGTLYGDGETAPYAVLRSTEEYTYLTLAAATEEGDVVLQLIFSDDALSDMICTRD